MTECEIRQPASEAADGDTATSRRVVVGIDADEAIAMVELIRPEDRIRINGRKRPIRVTHVDDTEDQRYVLLEGNGARYILELDRETSEMTLRVGDSGSEEVESLRVENRNPLNIREYERLLDEEIESTAPSDYFDLLHNSPTARDLETERSFTETESRVVRWALSGYLDDVARAYFGQNNSHTRSLWDDARTLWERFRHNRPITAYGSEMGKVGAVLDYAVEDPDIVLPPHVERQVDRLRRREEVEQIDEEPPWPETVPRRE